jgi:hypothetical protein
MRVVARGLALASEAVVTMTPQVRRGVMLDRVLKETGPMHPSPWPFRCLIAAGLLVVGFIVYQLVPMLFGDVVAALEAIGH